MKDLNSIYDFEVTDEIKIDYEADDSLDQALQMFRDEIMSETLALEFNRVNLGLEQIELNDKTVGISLSVL